ncbi:hypothetical protein ACLMJK_004763 [Lecanora helva]
MFLPRRRVTSLILASIIALAIWYLYYLPDFSVDSLKQTEGTESHVKPEKPATGPGDISPAIRTASGPDPTAQPGSSELGPPKIAPPASGSNLQKVFGQYTFQEKNPVKEYIRASNSPPSKIPKVQYEFGTEAPEDKTKRLERLAAVKASFEHSWQGYKKHAWMKDELSPLDGGSAQSFGGWAATLVDTLDTLWIIGMKEDFEEAVNAAKEINFNSTSEETLNVFETTIRYLGGFLGAYDLTNGTYPVLLQKAVEVGDLLYCAFDTPNRMPVTRFRWKEAFKGEPQSAGENTLIAEIGSLSLEFTRLSQITGDLKYFDAIQRIMNEFDSKQSLTKLPGLWPVVMNAKLVSFVSGGFSLGGMADSLYEYLPKQHMLLGGVGDQMKKMYEYSITAAMNHVFFQPMIPGGRDVLFSGSATVDGETKAITTEPRGQHLGCYAGGMVGIGAKLFGHPEHMNMARKLVDGCIWAYDTMPSGIMPEVFTMLACEMNSECGWDEKQWRNAVLQNAKGHDTEGSETKSDDELVNDSIARGNLKPGFVEITDPRYLLRPEAIESVFIHYRLTGEKDLLEAAWRMFQAIEKHTRTEFANAMINDVTVEHPEKQNKMESFWLAETLKYFYLIFSEPDVVSLDNYVL